MKLLLSKIVFGVSCFAALTACTSSIEKERQIEAIAAHRATILSNNLPLEHGPLTIMQAKAKGPVIELMMLYNGDSNVSPQKLVNGAVKYYCSESEVKANLEHGVIYDIKVRSPRGQLLIDQIVSEQTCDEMEAAQ